MVVETIDPITTAGEQLTINAKDATVSSNAEASAALVEESRGDSPADVIPCDSIREYANELAASKSSCASAGSGGEPTSAPPSAPVPVDTNTTKTPSAEERDEPESEPLADADAKPVADAEPTTEPAAEPAAEPVVDAAEAEPESEQVVENTVSASASPTIATDTIGAEAPRVTLITVTDSDEVKLETKEPDNIEKAASNESVEIVVEEQVETPLAEEEVCSTPPEEAEPIEEEAKLAQEEPAEEKPVEESAEVAPAESETKPVETEETSAEEVIPVEETPAEKDGDEQADVSQTPTKEAGKKKKFGLKLSKPILSKSPMKKPRSSPKAAARAALSKPSKFGFGFGKKTKKPEPEAEAETEAEAVETPTEEPQVDAKVEETDAKEEEAPKDEAVPEKEDHPENDEPKEEEMETIDLKEESPVAEPVTDKTGQSITKDVEDAEIKPRADESADEAKPQADEPSAEEKPAEEATPAPAAEEVEQSSYFELLYSKAEACFGDFTNVCGPKQKEVEEAFTNMCAPKQKEVEAELTPEEIATMEAEALAKTAQATAAALGASPTNATDTKPTGQFNDANADFKLVVDTTPEAAPQQGASDLLTPLSIATERAPSFALKANESFNATVDAADVTEKAEFPEVTKQDDMQEKLDSLLMQENQDRAATDEEAKPSKKGMRGFLRKNKETPKKETAKKGLKIFLPKHTAPSASEKPSSPKSPSSPSRKFSQLKKGFSTRTKAASDKSKSARKFKIPLGKKKAAFPAVDAADVQEDLNDDLSFNSQSLNEAQSVEVKPQELVEAIEKPPAPVADEPVADTTEAEVVAETPAPVAEEPVASSTEAEVVAEEPVASSTEVVADAPAPVADEPVASTTEAEVVAETSAAEQDATEETVEEPKSEVAAPIDTPPAEEKAEEPSS